MNLCYGCFSQINNPNGVCPRCGFSAQKYDVYRWTLFPGTVLNNKYILGKRLGEGGFGITYLAWDSNLNTKVAIKEYYPSNFVKRDVTSPTGNAVETTIGNIDYDFNKGLKKYMMEATILSKFYNLPGIVSVKDFFYENGTAYIVMEYIDGMSLKDYLDARGGKITAEETINLIQPVISSLSVVHNNKLLHRDISPDNIMINRDGNVKLIDFGTARSFDTDKGDKSMTVMLKHGYAPIEQYSRNGNQSAHTDIYAICAVMYRMITGVSPTEAPDRVRDDKLIPIRKIQRKTPKHIATAIEKGLSVLPENRQQSMAELEHDLFLTKSDIAISAANGIYNIFKKILLGWLLFLVVLIAIGIAYKTNKNKINDFRTKMKVAFSEDSNENEKTEKKQKKSKSKNDEKSSSEDNNDDIEKENIERENIDESNKQNESEKIDESIEQNESENIDYALDNYDDTETSNAANEKMREIEMTDADKEKVSYGIVVVRDGVITGNESRTTGAILDNYSDRDGTWSGFIDDNNQLYIYYTGTKQGEEFTIEFTVFENDTFRVTGAAKGGMVMSNYSVFFQEILYY